MKRENYRLLLLPLLFIMLFADVCMAADAKKPKIMVFPADDWCKRKGYITSEGTPDYTRALNDVDMDGAVAVMGDVMAEMGYEMFSLKQELKNLNTQEAYGMAITSKGDGMVRESDRDRVTRNVAADFIVELSLDSKPFGVRRAIEFKAQTIDAASKKILHGDIGSSSASSAPLPILVKEAIGGFIDNFCQKIDIAFTRIEQNGREGSIIFKIADDSPLHFEDNVTVDGESGELADYIQYWLEENAMDGNFSLTQKSRETLSFDQVRFPLFAKVTGSGFGAKKGRVKSLTMESFVAPISNALRNMNISVSTTPIGQGSVYVVLGGL